MKSILLYVKGRTTSHIHCKGAKGFSKEKLAFKIPETKEESELLPDIEILMENTEQEIILKDNTIVKLIMESSKEDNNQFFVIQKGRIHLKVFNTFDQAYVVEDKKFDIIIYEDIQIQMNNIFE